MMNNTRVSWLLAACLVGLSAPAWPDGGGGPDSPAESKDPDYQAGAAAIKAKSWDRAIERLTVAITREPRNADAWNFLGYAYRHMGDLDNSFKNYERALEINPKHRGAREYLGEAYLQANRLADAEVQLAALDKLCFLPCEQYSDLKEKIADYKRKKAGG